MAACRFDKLPGGACLQSLGRDLRDALDQRSNPMPAYMISDVEVLDELGFREYQSIGGPLFRRWGGNIIAMGRHEHLEGDWEPHALYILEFPSFEVARDFYYSTEYQAALKLRQKTANSRLMLLDGVPPG
jgi:uncharacterized protein (DUF1330 family)